MILSFDLSLKTHIFAKRNEAKIPIKYPHKDAKIISLKIK